MGPEARARFATELAAFTERRAAWLTAGAAGKWIVLRGAEALGPFDDYAQAWRSGIEAFQRPGFMVKQILETERPLVVSHVSWNGDQPNAKR